MNDARPEATSGAGIPRKLVGWTRYLVMLPVLGLAVGAVTLSVVATKDTIAVVGHVLAGEASEKQVVLDFIELADLYLLSTVLYIMSLGLFELFVDDTLPLPHWLEFHTLDDLKEKLIGVVVVVLGVTFLGTVIRGGDALSIAYIGGGIALVIGALSYFLGRIGKE